MLIFLKDGLIGEISSHRWREERSLQGRLEASEEKWRDERRGVRRGAFKEY
jgi:hypothetical protein